MAASHDPFWCPCQPCRQWRYQRRRWNQEAPEPDWEPDKFRD